MDVLHREVHAAVLADVEHLHDVLVVERRTDARLVEERLDEPRVDGELGANPLDDDVTREPRLPGGTREEHTRLRTFPRFVARAESNDRLVRIQNGPYRPAGIARHEACMTKFVADLASREPSVSDLLRTAVDDARDLVRAEVALAKDEARTEAKYAAISLFLILLGVLTAGLALSGLVFGIVTIAGTPPKIIPFVAGGAIAVLAALSFGSGLRLMAKQLLERTRGRVEEDIRQLRDGLQ